MVRAIFETYYKGTLYIETVPAPLHESDNFGISSFDSILFRQPAQDDVDHAPQRRRLDDVDELTRYLEAPVLYADECPLLWWKVGVCWFGRQNAS